MDRYEAYLLIHIVAAMVWVGGGVAMLVQGVRASRARDENAMERLLADVVAMGNTVFVPASIVVLGMGMLMVVDGPWEFDQLWIVLGLAGYLATFLTGVLIMKPSGDRIHAMIARDGGMTAESALETQKLLIKARADTAVLLIVVTVMVAKPTGADVLLLGTMAAILVVAVAYVAGAVHRVGTAAAPDDITIAGPGGGGIVGPA